MRPRGCHDCAYCSSSGDNKFCPANIRQANHNGTTCPYWEWAYS